MNLAAIASVIVGLCKASETCKQIAEMVMEQLAENRRTHAHADNEADRARITAGPWVCPRTCPHRGLHSPEQSAPAQGDA